MTSNCGARKEVKANFSLSNACRASRVGGVRLAALVARTADIRTLINTSLISGWSAWVKAFKVEVQSAVSSVEGSRREPSYRYSTGRA